MACHKVLIDYNEYVRLLNYEAKFEKESKKQSEEGLIQKGSGVKNTEKTASASSPSVSTPLLGVTNSITLPPSASETNTTLSTVQKKHEKAKKPTKDYKTDKQKSWYFLGIP